VRVFLAGASGVIGSRLLPLLVGEGHVVAAMTRSPGKAERLRQLGGEPVVCDVFDAERLTEAVTRFRPDAVMHQLTDLPDRLDELDARAAANDRIRSEGTRNLVAAAQAAAARGFVAQSITYYEDTLPPQPRVQLDDAVRATPPLLEAPSGIVTIVEPYP
jgi:nucleoside-diphosphate-sugar epimerase